MRSVFSVPLSFFFNDPATTEIYTLSLHDALPIRSASSGRDPHGSLASYVRQPVVATDQPSRSSAATTAAAMPARRLAPVTRAAGTERPYCEPRGVNYVAARLIVPIPIRSYFTISAGASRTGWFAHCRVPPISKRPESLSWAVAASGGPPATRSPPMDERPLHPEPGPSLRTPDGFAPGPPRHKKW